jgi:hypothetical protein
MFNRKKNNRDTSDSMVSGLWDHFGGKRRRERATENRKAAAEEKAHNKALTVAERKTADEKKRKELAEEVVAEKKAAAIRASHGGLYFLREMIISALVVIISFSVGSILLMYIAKYTKRHMGGIRQDHPPYTDSFPHVNYFTKSGESSIPYRFMRWLTKAITEAFQKNRFILDKFFYYIGKLIEVAPSFFEPIVLVLGILILHGLVIMSNFIGFITTIIGELINISDVLPNMLEFLILVLPFGIPLMAYLFFLFISGLGLGIGVGITQAVMMLVFLVLYPLLNTESRKGIIQSLIKNKYLLFLCIFSLMSTQRFGSLNETYGYVSIGFALAALIVFIFMKIF